ncbi:MAG: isoprenylcysteine carboxylmethyltransferase family protein [Pseudomonadota bacterium]
MKTRVPPPVILLMFGLAMWLLASRISILPFSLPIPTSFIALPALLGVGIAAAGVLSFSKVGTTVNPHRIRQASSLVTDGVFRRTRNPMYLGLLLVLLSWCLWLGEAANGFLLLLFVVAITELQIKPEEQVLADLFGDAFRDYSRRVRRWI